MTVGAETELRDRDSLAALLRNNGADDAERAGAGSGAVDDPLDAAMDAAIDRIAAAKARAEERDEASLAALLRIEQCLGRMEKLLPRAVDGGTREPDEAELQTKASRVAPAPARFWTWLNIIALIGIIIAIGWTLTPYWARIAQTLGLP
jgi:hypothetical protein